MKRIFLMMSALLLAFQGAVAAEVAQAICCANNTLYFDYREPVASGSSYEGSTVTASFTVPADDYDDYGKALAWQKLTAKVKYDITTVVFKEAFKKFKPKSCRSWFYDFDHLVEFKGLENLNTSEVVDMSFMFDSCIKLKTLDVNSFDVGKVTAASSMFYNCKSLTTIYCNQTWDIKKGGNSNAASMFYGCLQLVGAIAYDANNMHGTAETASPKGGYFTARISVNGDDVDKWYNCHGDLTVNGLTLYKDDKWHALCLPFALDKLKDTPLEGATIMELDAENSVYNAETFDATLAFKTSTAVEAGTPYMYKWASGTNIVNPTFKNVTVIPVGEDDRSASDNQAEQGEQGDEGSENNGNSENSQASVPSVLNYINFYGCYKQVEITAEDQEQKFVIDNNTISQDVKKYDAFSAYFFIAKLIENNARTVATVTLKLGETTISKRLGYSWAGNGTEQSPYLISTTGQLKELADAFNGADADKLKGKYFKQIANLAFDKTQTNNYTPINRFTGHYDGDGKVISGVNVDKQDSRAGIFATLDGATVENLIVFDIKFKGYLAGAIAGFLLKGSFIRNCHVVQTEVEGSFRAGGVTAHMNNDTHVIGCSSQASVKAGTDAGGIVGFATSSSSEIKDCLYLGTSVTGSNAFAILGNQERSIVGSLPPLACYYIAPTVTGRNAELMPSVKDDCTDFMTKLHARDEYLKGPLDPKQYSYDLTLNGRPMAAKKKGDGTWESWTYAVCAPFSLDLKQLVGEENLKYVTPYMLSAIKDEKELIFEQVDNEIDAGVPILLVVQQGQFDLKGFNQLIDVTPKYTKVHKWGDKNTVLGKWTGTFNKIEHDACVDMLPYILQKGGKYTRIRKDSPNAWVGAFVAFFTANEVKKESYSIVYVAAGKGGDDPEEDDEMLIPFSSDEYDAEFDIPESSDGISPVIHTIDNDGTNRYYDMQGRPLSGKPSKGMYIYNGKKMISK